MTIRSLIRSPIRSLVSSAFGGGGGLLSQATSQLGGVAPYHYWDFINNRALFAQADVGGVTSTPGWSFTRASAGYAETAAGVLVPFASGELRRTDKGVLIEGARTNLLTRSNEFDNAAWTNFNSVETAAAAVSPTGATDAFRLTDDSGTGTGSAAIFQNVSVTSATATTFSIFAKADQLNWIALQTTNYDATGNGTSYFNLSAGVVGTKDANHSARGITALGNGWYRVWIVYQSTTDIAGTVTVRVAEADTDSTVDRDGTSSILIFGAQVEAAAFPSSYIPTTTASATRAADVLTVSSPGVNYPLGLFAEAERVVDTGASENTLCLHTGNGNELALLGFDNSDLSRLFVSTGGVTQANATVSGATSVGVAYKVAGRVSTNDMIAARGGALSTQDTSCTTPSQPTTIQFGAQNGGGASLFGYLRRIAIFQGSKSDAELQAMTT